MPSADGSCKGGIDGGVAVKSLTGMVLRFSRKVFRPSAFLSVSNKKSVCEDMAARGMVVGAYDSEEANTLNPRIVHTQSINRSLNRAQQQHKAVFIQLLPTTWT